MVFRMRSLHVHRRHLHLLHQKFNPLGRNKLGAFETKNIAQITPVPFQLVDLKGKNLGTKTIAEAVKLVRPFSHLLPVEPTSNQIYRIFPLKNTLRGREPTRFKRLGSGKELHLTTTCEAETVTHFLSKAYEFLSKDYRVEFHLRPKAGMKSFTVDWALKNCIHLRPELILASMPLGTELFLKPVVDGQQIIWALQHNTLKQQELEDNIKETNSGGFPGLLAKEAVA